MRFANHIYVNRSRGLTRAAIVTICAGHVFGYPCIAMQDALAAPLVAVPIEHPAARTLSVSAWTITNVTTSARWPLRTDAVEAAMTNGAWNVPASNPKADANETDLEPFATAGGLTWKRLNLPASSSTTTTTTSPTSIVIPGALIAQGYARLLIERDFDSVVLLHGRGHSMLRVNGEPRAGDPYGHGYLKIPIYFKKGINELLVAGGRGNVTLDFLELGSTFTPTLALTSDDATLPDLVEGMPLDAPIGVIVRNATNDATPMFVPGEANSLTIRTRIGTEGEWISSPIGAIQSMTIRKISARVQAAAPTAELLEAKSVPLTIELVDQGAVVSTLQLSMRVIPKQAVRAVTYVSNVDGSTQYFAVLPAADSVDTSESGMAAQGLLLSLHGASVEAMNQASSYAAKPNLWIVAPTNRRPFGFDWEDWGRRDALDVLAHAQRLFKIDPRRVYLTGHSMGGHGTWQLASIFPDRFAAAAPSAGWESFASYGGWMPTLPEGSDGAQVQDIFRRSAATSQTALLKENLRDKPIYILHGDVDDNVPVAQARTMRELLTGIASPLEYHEQPGASHWWDDEVGPGAACLDWPGFFKLFNEHTLPNQEEISRVTFATLDPAISGTRNWITIEQQLSPGTLSTIDASVEGETLVVTTVNVRRFSVNLTEPVGSTVIDGYERSGTSFVKRAMPSKSNMMEWEAGFLPATQRGGSHSGPFKRAFDRDAILVFGTIGAPQENAWARAKAVYDAETFAYRGNGSFEVVSDVVYADWISQSGGAAMNRNVILYGNNDTNALYSRLLGSEPSRVNPVFVSTSKISLITSDNTKREIERGDLVCVMVRPNYEHPDALVGVVAPTGNAGAIIADRLPFFLSGAGFPDFLVLTPSMLSDTTTRGCEGVLGAGFFDHDWKLEPILDHDLLLEPIGSTNAVWHIE